MADRPICPVWAVVGGHVRFTPAEAEQMITGRRLRPEDRRKVWTINRVLPDSFFEATIRLAGHPEQSGAGFWCHRFVPVTLCPRRERGVDIPGKTD